MHSKCVREASVIFLCGGNPQCQMQLLNKLDLRGLIEISAAVVMGTSAGGMNMSAAYVDEGMICSGLALGHFSFEGHFDTTDAILAKERFALSKEMNVYVRALSS